MSNALMNKIFDIQMPYMEKYVLLVLSDQANAQNVCWPSITNIVKRTCLSRRSVFNALQRLEANGYLKRHHGNGQNNSYEIVDTPQVKMTNTEAQKPIITRAHDAPVQDMHQCTPCTGGVHDVHGGGAPRALTYIDEPPYNPKEPSIPPIIPQGGCEGDEEVKAERPQPLLPVPITFQAPAAPIVNRSKAVKSSPKEPRYRHDPEFMQFWEQYPRKRRGDPHAAYKTWQELIIAKEAHPEDILRGCVIYAHSREGSGDYAQGCQRWLNDYGWMKNYTTQGDPYAKFNPVRAMLNLQDTGGELEEGVDYVVICGERVLI